MAQHKFSALTAALMELQTAGNTGERVSGRHLERVNALAQEARRAADESKELYKGEIAKGTIGDLPYGDISLGSPSGAGDYAPIIPQSIGKDIATLCYSEDTHAMALRADIPSMPVYSTVFQQGFLKKTGHAFHHLAVGEGELGPVQEAEFKLGTYKIKFQADRRQVPLQASIVRTLTLGGKDLGNAMFVPTTGDSGLELHRRLSMLNLMHQSEIMLWTGNETCNPYAYDGIYQQIAHIKYTSGVASSDATKTQPWGYTDHQGGAFDPEAIITAVHNTYRGGQHGVVDEISMDPEHYAQLIKIAIAADRRDGSDARRNIYYGTTGGYFIVGPTGAIVPIKSRPLIRGPEVHATHTADSNSDAPDFSAITPTATAASAGGTTSYWTAADADAGQYLYRAIPVGTLGVGAPKEIAAVTVAAGQKVNLQMLDAAKQGTGSGKVSYWIIERSKPNGDATTTELLGIFPTNTAGTSSGTLIVDNNFHRPFTAPIIGYKKGGNGVVFGSLLDTTQVPLPMANNSLKEQFAVISWGSVVVRALNSAFVLDHVSTR